MNEWTKYFEDQVKQFSPSLVWHILEIGHLVSLIFIWHSLVMKTSTSSVHLHLSLSFSFPFIYFCTKMTLGKRGAVPLFFAHSSVPNCQSISLNIPKLCLLGPKKVNVLPSRNGTLYCVVSIIQNFMIQNIYALHKYKDDLSPNIIPTLSIPPISYKNY